MAVGAVIATAGVFVIAQGLTYPLLALILKKQGISATLIGANSAMTPLGVIVSAPFIPRLAQRIGAARLASLCAALAAMVLALIGANQEIWFWFPARFALGVAINGSYIVSETWVIQLSSSHNRGRIMGVYTTVLSGGFALGPFILALTGTEGQTPFMVVIAKGSSRLPATVAEAQISITFRRGMRSANQPRGYCITALPKIKTPTAILIIRSVSL